MAAPWNRMLDGGVTEEDFVRNLLAKWEGSNLGLARELLKILPPFEDGTTRSLDSIVHKIRRLKKERPRHTAPPPDGVRIIEQLSEEVTNWFELFDNLQELLEDADPIITSFERTFEDSVAIQFASDVHLGSRYAAHGEFRKALENLLRTERLYWGIHGDDIEGFLKNFRSSRAVFDQLVPPPLQRRLLALIIKHLAERGKVLYGCAGEHGGSWYEDIIGENLVKDIYGEGGIPFFDGKGVYVLHVGEQTYQIAVAHKFPGSSMYNPNHPQRRAQFQDFPQADMIVQGHSHTTAVQRVISYVTETDAGLRESAYTWLVQTGTAKTGKDPYTIRGWRRSLLDWPTFVFYSQRHEIRLVQCEEDLRRYLEE